MATDIICPVFVLAIKKGPVGPVLYLAEREGFEPSIRCRIHTFQACSFNHSDTSPVLLILITFRAELSSITEHVTGSLS